VAQKTYSVINGAAPGTNPTAAIATGTAATGKTMIQIATNATATAIDVIEWWCEFDGSAAATPIKVELLRHTSGPQTTLTAYGAGDIAKVNDPNAAASTIQLGTALSGFSNTTTEVAPTGTPVNLEAHMVPPTSGIYVQFPLGREPEVQTTAFLRIRTTAGASVNCYCGVMWAE
jgi:hypothetical protein